MTISDEGRALRPTRGPRTSSPTDGAIAGDGFERLAEGAKVSYQAESRPKGASAAVTTPSRRNVSSGVADWGCTRRTRDRWHDRTQRAAGDGIQGAR
jgi:hypothetical protein